MRAKESFGLDMHQIAEIWRFGSVVRSWLLDLVAEALGENPDLDGIKGYVSDSGEGRWTVFEAIDQDIPAPVITLSLMARFISRQEDSYAAKLLAAMRNKFGGHAIKHEE
jgi:6-phosphogluconate dehydrogenase